jgi:hypothetical protein
MRLIYYLFVTIFSTNRQILVDAIRLLLCSESGAMYCHNVDRSFCIVRTLSPYLEGTALNVIVPRYRYCKCIWAHIYISPADNSTANTPYANFMILEELVILNSFFIFNSSSKINCMNYWSNKDLANFAIFPYYFYCWVHF